MAKRKKKAVQFGVFMSETRLDVFIHDLCLHSLLEDYRTNLKRSRLATKGAVLTFVGYVYSTMPQKERDAFMATLNYLAEMTTNVIFEDMIDFEDFMQHITDREKSDES